jgi:hypothetical protein
MDDPLKNAVDHKKYEKFANILKFIKSDQLAVREKIHNRYPAPIREIPTEKQTNAENVRYVEIVTKDIRKALLGSISNWNLGQFSEKIPTLSIHPQLHQKSLKKILICEGEKNADFVG